jgi:hypothetical protein
MILIMGVPYGDSEHDSGKKRSELNDLMTFEELLAENTRRANSGQTKDDR